MKTELSELKGSHITISFEVDDKDIFSRYEEKAIADLGKDIAIDGYRAGKIPASVLKKHLDERLIHERTLELLAEKMLKKAILEKEIIVLETKFALKKYVPGQLAEFEITVTTLPHFELPDYRNIAADFGKKNRKEAAVSDKEINDTLAHVRKSRAKYTSSVAGAKNGDLVDIDFSLTVAGEQVPDNEQKHYQFILGEEQLVPGFAEHIAGMKAGEERTFALRMPKEYWRDDLRGKEAEFHVVMHSVLERELPELNDAFAQSVGNFADLAALRNSIAEGMRAEKQKEEKEKFTLGLLNDILKHIAVEIPRVLTERERENIYKEFEQNLSSKGIEKEAYLKQLGKKEEEIKKDMAPQAEKNIKVSLFLKELVRAENIMVPAEDVMQRAEAFLRQHNSAEAAQNAIDPEHLRHYTESTMQNQKAMDLLAELAGWNTN